VRFDQGRTIDIQHWQEMVLTGGEHLLILGVTFDHTLVQELQENEDGSLHREELTRMCRSSNKNRVLTICRFILHLKITLGILFSMEVMILFVHFFGIIEQLLIKSLLWLRLFRFFRLGCRVAC
jgi:hypothetical protein